MEIRLKKLEIEGFRSFKDRQVIEFPDGDSIILITGKWKGSETSSGSGKTSIIEAIAFCLDISSASAVTLKNWDSKKLFVKLTLMAGTDLIEIVRDPKLSLAINGVPYEGMVKGAKERLQEILGENTEMLKSITYRKQRVRGKMVNSTDSQIKEFLTQPLGLNEVENAVEKFTQAANRALSTTDLIKRDIANYEMSLQMNLVTAENVEQANKALLQAQQAVPTAMAGVEQAEASRTEAYIALNSAQASLSEAVSKLESLPTAVEQKALAERALLIKQEIEKINRINLAIQSKRQENSSLKETIVRLQSEAENLGQGVCPTCKRDWEESNKLKEQKLSQIDSLIFNMTANVEYIKNSEPLIAELPYLNQNLQEVNQKLGETSAPVEMAKKNVEVATQGVQAAKSRLSSAENNIMMAKHGVLSAQNAVSGAQQNVDNLKSKSNNYTLIAQKLAESKSLLEATERDIEINLHCSKLLGKNGFLGSVFDEILLDIQTRTNDMLAHYPNASQFTVEINSSKLIKSKGTTKKEITIDVSKNGRSVSLEDDLSGGQQAAIELCSDLALAETIRARSGKSLKWVCLDEVMDGLGAAEKEAVVQMIKQRAKGLVLMIEHATEIKESFDNVIMVEYDGKESNVVSEYI
jgi:DNA repair exonuclease SbcCD ATPase subunit